MSPVLDPVREGDLDAVLAIEQLSFDRAEQWSRTSWEGELAAADRIVLGWREDGVLCGLATFQVVADVADLNRIMVEPTHRGRGAARVLLEAGCRQSFERGAGQMMLEVRHDNQPAIGLYEACGFQRLAVRRDYYGAGSDAIVMSRPLGLDEAVEARHE